MTKPQICLTLTGKTLQEDLKLVKKYDRQIDLVELRVDYLNEEEQIYAKNFPKMTAKPCILTIRRDTDGGKYDGGEFSRTTLFARILSFAKSDKSRNFAFVDFEDDFHVPSIQDAAMAFEIKIIRSYHNMNGSVLNIREKFEEMRRTGFEIPKIAFMPSSLSDVVNMFREGSAVNYDHILCAMGNEGLPSRILSGYANSFLTYVSPLETLGNTAEIGHLDPCTINDLYNFRHINEHTQLYGITGWPLLKTSSPQIHNEGYRKLGMNSVYLPVRSSIVSEALNFCEYMGFRGLSVTIPHKEAVLYYVNEQSPEVMQIGSCNTIVRKNNTWIGYNTDAYGFRRALEEFLGDVKIKHKKVAVIGSGGAAKAVVFALKQMGAKVCIFNRTIEHARLLAERYGYEYCQLDSHCAKILDEYSTLIVQTTSVGMNATTSSTQENDPLYFYDFRGDEMIFDLIYVPDKTPIMKRAEQSGCKVCNGYKMLEYQAYEQFKLFTGRDIENI